MSDCNCCETEYVPTTCCPIPKRLCLKFKDLAGRYACGGFGGYKSIDGLQTVVEYDPALVGWPVTWVQPTPPGGWNPPFTCPLSVGGVLGCGFISTDNCMPGAFAPAPDCPEPGCGWALWFSGGIGASWFNGAGCSCMSQAFVVNYYVNQYKCWVHCTPDYPEFSERLILGLGLQIDITAAPCWALSGGLSVPAGNPPPSGVGEPHLTQMSFPEINGWKPTLISTMYIDELGRELTGDLLTIYLGTRPDGSPLDVDDNQRRFFVDNYIKSGRDGIALAKNAEGRDTIVPAANGCGCGKK